MLHTHCHYESNRTQSTPCTCAHRACPVHSAHAPHAQGHQPEMMPAKGVHMPHTRTDISWRQCQLQACTCPMHIYGHQLEMMPAAGVPDMYACMHGRPTTLSPSLTERKHP